jgi:predicted small secreted protein
LIKQMKTALTIGILVALVAASAALAGTRTYRGAVKGDDPSSVTLKVKQTDGDRELKLFAARDLLISCQSGSAKLQRAAISGLIPVNDKGRFSVSGTSAGQVLRVSGKLIGKRNAKGTVRYFGPTPVDGVTENCDSGKLDWSASR